MRRALPADGIIDERDLVAIALPPGPGWMDLVHEVWAAGAALLPVDSRLPPAEAESLLRLARPTVVVSDHGGDPVARRQDGGVRVDRGVILVVHTSGTAGDPKLVQFDRRAIDAAVAASTLALEATPRDPWLCCLPLAHVGGMLVLLRGVLLEAPVMVHPSFDPELVAAERDVAFVSVVPRMLGRLLDARVELSAFRAILVGGAHLAPDLRARAERAGAHVVETYGLTESCGGVVYDGLPLPGVEMRMNEEGGIELRGPMLMLGYRFEGEATERAFTDDGWLRPGDAGEIDAEGRLHVVGRIDDLINTGGEKVWPQEVEAALREHPAVAEVGVGGRLDPEWGQRVVAFVVPRDPAVPPTLETLRHHVAGRIGRHKAPRELVLVDELPRTVSGKLRRTAFARD
ncbi:MAG: class I adenylate-forming enzyme family protein [Actinomycetota bacterium]